MPSQNIINQFISKDVVVQRILTRHISATNEAELRHNGSLIKIVKFVREAFKIHYKGGDTRRITGRIKELDSMTKGLVILSRSEHNLASSLMVIVHYYISCLTFEFSIIKSNF